ncbi:MAG: aminomethyl-transferring glycine dehydrogenase [Myxococcales bacterium FL481]|nr:MAG: aminomethyl-transferring glycine dehydrogenase [Myxococcales bacterium FL481]
MPWNTPNTSFVSKLAASDLLTPRHIGLREADVAAMLEALSVDSLDALIHATIPSDLLVDKPVQLAGLDGRAWGESELLARLQDLAERNDVKRSLLGMGYHACITPGVILRNVLENPGWYTAYTPYQAEIAQGRLEVLMAFQTMVADLTGLPLSNASLLDEATAAAEAMAMCAGLARGKRSAFFVDRDCHPQVIAVVQTRGAAVGIDVRVGDYASIDFSGDDLCGVLVQYPTTDGRVLAYDDLAQRTHDAGASLVVAADLMALVALRPPGEFGADVVVGSTQRFGVPMGFGGPHAAFLATSEANKRFMPGRLIGQSKDARGEPAFRMAMQTREQHIRREKATSNICTAQVLLAVIAAFYGMYHGPAGLRRIAGRIHGLAEAFAVGVTRLGHAVASEPRFDTVRVSLQGMTASEVVAAAASRGFNLRQLDEQTVCVAFDECSSVAEVDALLAAFVGVGADASVTVASLGELDTEFPVPHARTSDFMQHPSFSRFHAEHEMLRYIHRLQSRDLSLTTSMISLGSCTMKLNATSEMIPVTWPGFGQLHPFAPAEQTAGYRELFDELETWLAAITGMDAVSLQPNAGSQGEYTGLMVIRAYHRSIGEAHRDVCLIPVSAHGTNPASAVMAGMKIVKVQCDDRGNIDVDDLRAKADKHGDAVAALMVTYPSTHGVFEERIREICTIVHDAGGQVYLDGANMNAQVGLCRPGDYGADVCHLNLHKTFAIPHGGGGPGMGPIAVKSQLAPFLPGHPVVPCGGEQAIGAIAAAPWSSASILPISWMYIAGLGDEGIAASTRVAILSANYMAQRLEQHYPVLYRGANGRVAHEFILDLRPLTAATGVEAEDVAKRLIDFGFHAPTMSFPVAGTLMIEPTESESKAELDRFCDAMIAIREEIAAIEQGASDRSDNPLKNAPHPVAVVAADAWDHAYSREQAAYPAPWLSTHKYWPPVCRVDNVWGDRHLVATLTSEADDGETA